VHVSLTVSATRNRIDAVFGSRSNTYGYDSVGNVVSEKKSRPVSRLSVYVPANLALIAPKLVGCAYCRMTRRAFSILNCAGGDRAFDLRIASALADK
jgi:hypothetical protein